MNRHFLGITGAVGTFVGVLAWSVFSEVREGSTASAAQAVQASGQEKEATFRIGTFQRTELMVAFHRSKQHDDVLKELIRQRDEARAAGQDARAKELDAQGAAMQERAHRQLAGEAPITNILTHLKDAWPDAVCRRESRDRRCHIAVGERVSTRASGQASGRAEGGRMTKGATP
jgi:hypothetical protein